MLTRNRFDASEPTGDWAIDGPRLYRSLRMYFDGLNAPGVLNLTQTRIENCTHPTGDWTPTIIGSGTDGVQTYTTQTGRYIDFGDAFWISGRIVLATVGGTIAGNMLIGGLPFTCADESGAFVGSVSVAAYDNLNLSAGYSQIGISPTSNAATLSVIESGDNVAAAQLVVAAIGGTAGIVFGGMIRKA